MPYRSDAQRKKFHAMEERGEISPKVVKEFDEASRGLKLPKKVKKAHGGEVKSLADHNHESHSKGGHCYACGGMVKPSRSFAKAITEHGEK